MIRVRKKIALFVVGLIVLGVAVFAVFVFVAVLRSTPSEAVVRREFLNRYPGATIRNTELIFEQNGNVVYLITAREKDKSEEGKYDFALDYSDEKWTWCDDRTERKCKKLWE
ncbi:MAG: hypothetical protein IT174_00715 [Acidobacteria bacterium]|nr:hypothetical protein [Acidobacteriota bacterium]